MAPPPPLVEKSKAIPTSALGLKSLFRSQEQKKALLILTLGLAGLWGSHVLSRSPARKAVPKALTLTLLREKEQSYVQISLNDHREGSEKRHRQSLKSSQKNWPQLQFQKPVHQVDFTSWSAFIENKDSALDQSQVIVISPKDLALPQTDHAPPLRLLPANQDLTQLTLLIDRSGTMGYKKDAQSLSHLEQVRNILSRERKNDPRDWKLFSFSDSLTEHATISPQDHLPLNLFEKSRGHTQFLHALEQISGELNSERQHTIAIFSDGLLDTRHLPSIKKTLSQLKARGWSIHMVPFPQQALDEGWRELEKEQLISLDWPKLDAKNFQSHGRKTFIDPIHQLSWGPSFSHHPAAHLIPLLYGPEGALLYLDPTSKFPTYYATAEPQNPNRLSAWITKQFQKSPVVQLQYFPNNQNHRFTIHIPGGDPENRQIAHLKTFGGSPKSILPMGPNIYQLDPEYQNQIRFFHPNTGSFTLGQLQNWYHYCQNVPIPHEESPKASFLPMGFSVQSMAILCILAVFFASLKVKLN